MKKIFFSLSIIVFSVISTPEVHADSFVIHLFYDAKSKNLKFDSKYAQPVTRDKEKYVSIVEFAQNDQKGNYSLKIYDAKNNEIASTQLNPKDGAFELDIPYFSLGDSMKILETSTRKEVLSADLSDFKTCNGNEICELEKGENALNCIGDCASSHVGYSEQTQNTLKENNGIIKDPETGQTLLQDKAFSKDAITGRSQNTGSIDATNSASTSSSSSNLNVTDSPNKTALLLALIAGIIVLVALGIVIYLKRSRKK